MATTDVDMTQFTAPKSDQLNADDLIGGPRTITVTGVRGTDAADQPVAISFEGDNSKPYKPCKSMRRVMVHVWGADAKQYVGRSMTLYCDPGVQFGGMKVGGIRISHMSNMDKPQTMALTATRAKRAPFTVQPLAVEPEVKQGSVALAESETADLTQAIKDATDAESLSAAFSVAWSRAKRANDTEARAAFKAAYDKRKGEL
jgi:hypothetical protein